MPLALTARRYASHMHVETLRHIFAVGTVEIIHHRRGDFFPQLGAEERVAVSKSHVVERPEGIVGRRNLRTDAQI